MPPPPPLPILSGKHQLLKLRLAPLRSVETDLRRRLGAGAEEDYGIGRDAGVLGDVTNNGNGSAPLRRKATKEFTVRRVKDALDSGIGANGYGGASSNGHGYGNANGKRREEDVDEATEVIASCADDIRELWGDEVVRSILKRRRIRLEDGGGL
jgi:guanine nucleotide-binding protein subunit alpha